MGDSVERALEETISILKGAQRLKLLSHAEVRSVVQHRRDHEYTVSQRNANRSAFLKYVAFERELASTLLERAKQRGFKKNKYLHVVGKSVARVNLVYSRAVRRFPGDVDLWLHYARHCIRSGSKKAPAKVFAKALGFRGDSEQIWLAAVSFHFDTCGDARGARTLAQRALRALPDSINLWKEYYRMEVCFLAKLLSRRIAMGLTPAASVKDQAQSSVTAPSVDAVNTSAADTSHREDSPIDQQEGQEETGEKEASEMDNEGEPEGALSAKDTDTIEQQSDDESSLEITVVTDKAHSDSLKQSTETQKLSFWEGGVPLAVLTNACKAVTFSPKHLVELWDITVNTPFAPTNLMHVVSKHLSEAFPNCVVCQLLGKRMAFDVALADLQLRKVSHVASGKHKESSSNDDAIDDQDKAELQNVACGAARGLQNTFMQQVSGLDEHTQKTVHDCINDFISTLYSKCSFVVDTEDVKSLVATAKRKETTAQVITGESELQNETRASPADWSLERLTSVLNSDEELCNMNEIYETIKGRVLVPFRDYAKEQALLAWIQREEQVKRLRETAKLILSLPPLTSQCLHGLIKAELRLCEKEHHNSVPSGEKVASLKQTRRLFQKAISLPSAKDDVSLWLDFVDFESKVAKDAQKAAMVNWNALKTLSQSSKTLFLERMTVRRLGNA